MLESESIEFIKWQVAQQVDATVDQLGDFPKVIELLFLGTFENARVGRWPMRNNGLSRPNRTMFLGVIANRNNEIEDNVLVLVPGFLAGVGSINSIGLPENANGVGVDFGTRLGTSAE